MRERNVDSISSSVGGGAPKPFLVAEDEDDGREDFLLALFLAMERTVTVGRRVSVARPQRRSYEAVNAVANAAFVGPSCYARAPVLPQRATSRHAVATFMGFTRKNSSLLYVMRT